MYTLRKVTDTTWLAVDNSSETDDFILVAYNIYGQYTILHNNKTIKFDNKTDLAEYIGQDVFDTDAECIDTSGTLSIGGYPVNGNTPSECSAKDTDLPVYINTESGVCVRAAGFYCVLNSKGWKVMMCPTFSLLTKYEYAGPYKTKDEATSFLAVARRDRRKSRA